MRRIFFFTLICILSLTSNSFSDSFQLDFTINNLISKSYIDMVQMGYLGLETSPSPYSPITGSITYEATSINSPIDSISSMNLSIGSYSYDTSNTMYINYSDLDPSTSSHPIDENLVAVVGSPNEQGIVPGSDDFWLRWDRSTLQPYDFRYSTSDVEPDIWSAFGGNFESFSISNINEPEPTPEPQQYALLVGFGENGTASMEQYLSNNGWINDDIDVLPTDAGIEDITTKLLEIESKLNPDDEFVFYYKGHGGVSEGDSMGETHKSGSFFEVIGLDFFHEWAADEALKPNGETLYDDDFTQLFNTDKWDAINKTFILDSCFSGGFVGGDDSNGQGDLDILPKMTLLYSSPEDQRTPTTSMDDDGLTILTNFILNRGYGEKQADGILAGDSPDGIVTMEELQKWWSLEIIKIDLWDEMTFSWGWWLDDVLNTSGPVPDDFNIMDYIDIAGFYTNQSEEYLNSKGFLSSLSVSSEPVPEPSTILLLGAGLIGIAGWHRRKSRKQ